MWYKEYGKTGIKVSALGFGGMRFRRREAEVAEYDADACIQVVRDARLRGVNYFDTAPFYCDDQSEILMGQAFARMKADGLGAPGMPAPSDMSDSTGAPLLPLYVSTKSGEHDGGKLREQLERSLTRLGLARVDFFNIWCIMDRDDYRKRMARGGAWEAAMKAKEEGLIGHVVCSSHCTGEEIAEIARDRVFEGITIGYNIVNWRFRRTGLEACQQEGMGVVTMNPLGGGLIPSKADRLSHLKAPGDPGMVEAALRFNASDPGISVVLAGMGTREEVAQNADLAERMGKEASSGTDHAAWSAARRAVLEGSSDAALDSLCTGCQYCLPCPRDIPIPKMMMAYNGSVFGSPKDSLNELKWHWHLDKAVAADCIACGACEQRCTQHLPIIRRLEEMKDWAPLEP